MILLQTEIILPTFGLFFWSTLIFLLFFFILRRFAWNPILEALRDREHKIESSLEEAAKAREEIVQLQANNEALIKEARAEREKIIRDANSMKDQIINQAKEEAAKVTTHQMEKARQEIEAQKLAALNEIKNTAGTIAVDIAEKILKNQFSDRPTQENYAKKLVAELDSQL